MDDSIIGESINVSTATSSLNNEITNVDLIKDPIPIIQSSSHPQTFDVLVLGPGGLKGFMELGALYRLNDGFLDGILTYVGVSIGSIICMLHLCGLSFIEISDVGIDINLFANLNIGNIGDMIEGKGMVSHSLIRDILHKAILRKRSNIPTFTQLYQSTGKNFMATSYNLTRRKTYYFTRFTHPDMSVVEASIASSSIPGIFYQYMYRNEIYIDGAFGNPYPIDVVDDGSSNILGIYIHNGSRLDPSNLTKNLSAILHAPISELRRRIIENSSKRCKHLILDSNINGMQVDREERVSMFHHGYQTAISFLISLNLIPKPISGNSNIQTNENDNLSNVVGAGNL